MLYKPWHCVIIKSWVILCEKYTLPRVYNRVVRLCRHRTASRARVGLQERTRLPGIARVGCSRQPCRGPGDRDPGGGSPARSLWGMILEWARVGASGCFPESWRRGDEARGDPERRGAQAGPGPANRPDSDTWRRILAPGTPLRTAATRAPPRPPRAVGQRQRPGVGQIPRPVNTPRGGETGRAKEQGRQSCHPLSASSRGAALAPG